MKKIFIENFLIHKCLMSLYIKESYLKKIKKKWKFYFEEKINEKQSKKFFGSKNKINLLLNSKEYDYEENNIEINIENNLEISKYDKEYFINEYDKIYKKLLLYGIIITKKNENEIFFTYPIFPKLITEFIFKLNIDNYKIPLCYYKEIDNINNQILSFSHLNTVKNNKISEMENYIYLIWIKIFLYVFGIVKKKKKDIDIMNY